MAAGRFSGLHKLKAHAETLRCASVVFSVTFVLRVVTIAIELFVRNPAIC